MLARYTNENKKIHTYIWSVTIKTTGLNQSQFTAYNLTHGNHQKKIITLYPITRDDDNKQ